jgi:acetyl esterase
MPLHPQVEGLLQQMAAAGAKGFSEMTVDECRQTFAGMLAGLPPSGAAIASVIDRKIPGPGIDIPVRLYTPEGNGPFPILMFFHGGGFVIGDLETHDAVCRELCAGSQAVVVAVDYRLAPEHPFPAAPDDCMAATRWAAANAAEINGDAQRMAVSGDSAGGNLAAVVAQQSVQEGPMLCAQLLIYPATCADGTETPSMVENASGYLLERSDMDWFLGHYLPNESDRSIPRSSPIHNTNLAGLAPALVITAEYDPLRDEGEAYARAMQAAGVDVEISRYDGAIHAFYSFFPILEQGRAAIDESNRWLTQHLAP